ncbi:MAG: metal-dependent transcriptional regulator [Flavobacteriaceae bacterium]|nr:metal-dependent transcriptional regulator [Flavobacteriaceae bacterium]
MSFTRSEENYLKAIYHLADHGVSKVSTNAIATRMRTKASSVTDMIKKLSDKNLVIYQKYQGVNLTEVGQEVAVKIIRKHRLWEVFLVEKLNFGWDEVHDIAEQLEHIESEKLVDRLDEFLEFPSHDPHGDPIPDKQGEFKPSQKVVLSDVEPGSICFCVGVIDSSSKFLRYLDKNGINLGTQLKVVSKEDFDKSMKIKTKGNTMVISYKISNNLFVIVN